MSRPRNTEPQANGALARALSRRNPDWNDRTVHAERTHVIHQALQAMQALPDTGKRPDILVAPPRRQPVIVETEFAPARTVEQDATARLGTSLHSTGEDIEGVLSVVLPESLKTGDLETVDRAAFRYATHYLDAKGESIRWPPEREWLEGGVDDLSDAIEWLSLSERQLARGTEALEQVVRNAAGLLAEHAGEGSLAQVARDLHQGAGEQTERMAAAICVSAFVFHVAIEDQEHIPPVPLAGSINKGSLLNTWNEILAVNYWPIFSVARDVKQIREVLTTGRKRVMDATLPGDVLRAAQYNLIIKQLRVALDHTTSKLPYAKRKDIFDALDWYHVKFLYATKDERDNPVFRDLPDGSWPTTEMQESQAVDKFKRLESIKWLKLKPYTSA